MAEVAEAPRALDPRLIALKRVAIVPALNEQEAIALVIDEIRAFDPGLEIVVIDDGSVDRTAVVAEQKGAHVIRLPYNLVKGPFIGWDAPQVMVSSMGAWTMPQLAFAAAIGFSAGSDVLKPTSTTAAGNLIILAHDAGYATVYAHNRENRARSGDDVRQGDVIALVGRTGKTSGANLHFEIRKDNVARNPLYFLPPLPDVVQRSDDRPALAHP